MRKVTLAMSSMFFTCSVIAADWDNVTVPADAGVGNMWQLQRNFSDDFNYTGKKGSFKNNWNDTYLNGWTGPGLTHWTKESSKISNGHLIIGASRRAGTNKVNTGVVTSINTVKYPVFLEANIKVSNLELSSNFWLLSKNDRREIDVLEVYGGAKETWFAKNMGTNFHLFFRDKETNAITSDFTGHANNTPSTGTYWRESFHRFGVYWKSPTDVTFYIDGQKTPNGSWAQSTLKDKDFTGAILDKSRYSMDEAMHIILDTEDHVWRSKQGIVATDANLADNNKNKMYVDWIRVYKPVMTSPQ